MNTDAKCAANFVAEHATDTHYHGALYDDGMVLYLAVDANRLTSGQRRFLTPICPVR